MHQIPVRWVLWGLHQQVAVFINLESRLLCLHEQVALPLPELFYLWHAACLPPSRFRCDFMHKSILVQFLRPVQPVSHLHLYLRRALSSHKNLTPLVIRLRRSHATAADRTSDTPQSLERRATTLAKRVLVVTNREHWRVFQANRTLANRGSCRVLAGQNTNAPKFACMVHVFVWLVSTRFPDVRFSIFAGHKACTTIGANPVVCF